MNTRERLLSLLCLLLLAARPATAQVDSVAGELER